MFFVIIYSAIDQGYIGLSLASCHKDEIWDLGAELGLIWDHFRALVPIGTKSQFGQKFRNREVSKPKCQSLILSDGLIVGIVPQKRLRQWLPQPKMFQSFACFCHPGICLNHFLQQRTLYSDSI